MYLKDVKKTSIICQTISHSRFTYSLECYFHIKNWCWRIETRLSICSFWTMIIFWCRPSKDFWLPKISWHWRKGSIGKVGWGTWLIWWKMKKRLIWWVRSFARSKQSMYHSLIICSLNYILLFWRFQTSLKIIN